MILIVSMAGIMIGSALFAIGLITSIAWLTLLGFIFMPAALILGLQGANPSSKRAPNDLREE